MKRFYGTPDPHNLSWCEAGLGWGGGGGGGGWLGGRGYRRGGTRKRKHIAMYKHAFVFISCVCSVGY